MTDPTDAQLHLAIAKLSTAQRAFFEREVRGIGNPEVYVPLLDPEVRESTWTAIERLGCIERGRFGRVYTPLGNAIRRYLFPSDATVQTTLKLLSRAQSESMLLQQESPRFRILMTPQRTLQALQRLGVIEPSWNFFTPLGMTLLPILRDQEAQAPSTDC